MPLRCKVPFHTHQERLRLQEPLVIKRPLGPFLLWAKSVPGIPLVPNGSILQVQSDCLDQLIGHRTRLFPYSLDSGILQVRLGQERCRNKEYTEDLQLTEQQLNYLHQTLKMVELEEVAEELQCLVDQMIFQTDQV